MDFQTTRTFFSTQDAAQDAAGALQASGVWRRLHMLRARHILRVPLGAPFHVAPIPIPIGHAAAVVVYFEVVVCVVIHHTPQHRKQSPARAAAARADST